MKIMKRLLTPALSVQRNVTIRRIRELPVPGKIHVSEASFVNQSDVVASAELPGDLIILRLPEQMGIEPFEVLKGLKVREGDRLEAGTVICEHAGLFGLFKTRYQSPYAGIVELISRETAHIGVRLPSTRLDLGAYISGRIVDVQAGKSVTVETRAALIQGIFGVGGERQGILELLSPDGRAEIEEKDVPADCAGKILAGGCSPSAAALEKARESGAAGFVTGSIDSETLRRFLGFDIGIAVTGNEEIPMSLVITEGFGLLPLSPNTTALLESLNGKIASMNGATQVRAGAIRPEIIVCEDPSAVSEDEVSAEIQQNTLEVGAKVRIIRSPNFGEVAVVEDLPAALTRLASGGMARVAIVALKDGSKVTVARSNLEMV